MNSSEYKFEYNVNGIPVYCTHEIPYEDVVRDTMTQLNRIHMKADYVLLRVTEDGWVEGKPCIGKPPKFERIRRITGYLVGTLERFNDAKRAEESQRVKHKVKQ